MNEQQLAAVKQALEALENYQGFIEDAHILEGQWHWIDGADKAITALQSIISQDALDKKAENARELGLSYDDETAPVQDSTCNETLRVQGKAYPRTCKKCGLGPCVGKPKPVTTPPAPQPVPVKTYHDGKPWPVQPAAHQCHWLQVDDEHTPDTWQGACGAVWTFTEGGPNDNDQAYCPKCGGVCIEVREKNGGAA